MEENSVSVKQVSIRYGLISGLAAIVFFVVINLLGQGMNRSLSYVGFLITATIIFLAHKAFKEEGDGYMNYGQGLGIGTLVALISGVISSVFTYIYVSYINTGYIQQLLDFTREQMEDQGQPDAQIEQAMGFMEKLFSPGLMTIIGLVSAVFIGFIISLIVSAITQNKRPEAELL
jgi:uncharacterized membrane protein YhfC